VKRRIGFALGIALLLAGAAGGYFQFVVEHHTERARLANLIVTSPPPGFTHKPSSTNQVAASSSPYSAFKAAAKKAPSSSGSYSVSWSNPASASDSATILLSLLPTTKDAGAVEQQAVRQYLGTASFKAESYVLQGPVPVTVPGGRGEVFVASGKATTPPVAAVTFATGRAQALVLLGQIGTPEATGATASALAAAEYRLLRERLPGFTMEVTSVPGLATAVYWLVTAAVLLAVVGAPVGVRRTRAARVAARERAARRQHQVRGSKIARRQARRR
jgi:hypothetical protein